MSDLIELDGIRCSVIIGVLPEERLRAQPVSIDLSIARDFAAAALNDDITATTNYASLISLAVEVVTEGQFQLLETAVYRVAQAILDADSEISAVTVAITKLRPPVPEDLDAVRVRCSITR
jgi:dihydroneopterin aldolase